MGRPGGIGQRVDVERVDADQCRARPHEPVGGIAGQERVVAEVGLGSPMLVPTRGHEDGSPADIDALERVRPDGAIGRATAVDENAVDVDDALQLEAGQVLPIGKSMGRHVDVRPGVCDEVDATDLERRARRIPAGRRLMRQERRDRRHRDTGMGRHPVDDLVAQIHDLAVRNQQPRSVPPPVDTDSQASDPSVAPAVRPSMLDCDGTEVRQSRHDERRTEPE